MKYRGIGLAAAAAVLFLTSTPILVSQENRTCLFPTVDLSASDEYQEYREIITRELRAQLRRAGYAIVEREEWNPARERQGVRVNQLYQGTYAVGVAREVGADLAVVSFYSASQRELVLEIKCYDVQQNALVAGVFKTARINLSVYNVIEEAVAELLPDMRLIGPPPAIDTSVVERITLQSKDEGMQVYLGEQGLVGRISDGELVMPPIPFAIDSKITIEKRKDEYHTGTETIKLKEPQMTVKLKPLNKAARTATEINWTLGQLLGFGLAHRYYFNPDSFFVAGEHYFYVQHAFAEGKPVFHHDLRVLVGGYLFTGPHSTLRINMTTGFGMIVTYFWLRDQPMYADYYWNLINTAIELNFRRFMIYIRTEQKYALGLGPAHILERGWMSVLGDGPPNFTLGIARKW